MALRATVRTFPKTAFYDLEETLTSLGIGEAVVTVLDARGSPTPVVATRLIPPASRMAPLTPEELQADIRQSDLLAEYGQAVDRESAREMLAARMAKTQAPPPSRRASGRRRPTARAWRSGGEDRGPGRGRRPRRRAVIHHRADGRARDHPRDVRPARRQAAAHDHPAVAVVGRTRSPGREGRP